MADVYNLRYFNAVNKVKKKKKVKDTGKQYTNEELARIQTVSRLPAFQQKAYYKNNPVLKARVKERTETAYKLNPGTVGFMEALNPVSTEKTITRAVGKLKLAKPKKTTAYKIGSALGTMAQFASTGGLAQNAVSKGLYKGTSTAGKVLAKTGSNAITGLPVNISIASKEKNPVKSLAVNTGLDIVTGGLMDSPAVVRAIKNLKGKKAVLKTKSPVKVSAIDTTPTNKVSLLNKDNVLLSEAKTPKEAQIANIAPKTISEAPVQAKPATPPTQEVPQIDSVNPTGSVFADYNPKARAESKLADNMVTLDKTIGGNPDDLITVYRGAPSIQTKINAGDYITTNKQLAKDYAGDGKVIKKTVRKKDIIDDLTEPGNEEYLFRPQTLTATDLKLNTGEFKVETSEGTKVPKFNNTAYPYMTEEVKASVQNELDQGKGLFTSNKLKKLQAKSVQKIETASPEDIDKMYKNFMASNDLSANAQADGVNLALYYQGIGDVEKATEVGMATAERFSQIGSSLNTAKLIQKFTPEGRQQIVFNMMNKLQNSNSKMLNGKKLEISPKTLKAVKNAKDEIEIDKALRNAQIELLKQIPVSFYQKMDTARYIFMLGNPKTHIRNILGNALFQPLIEMKNALGTGLESLAYKTGIIDEKTKSITYDKNAYKYASDLFDKTKDSIVSNSSKYTDNQIPLEVPIYKSKTMETARQGVMGALEKEDVLFLKPSYSKAFARYIKANKLSIENLTEKELDRAKEIAKSEALNNTFRDASLVSDWFSKNKTITSESTAGSYAKAIALGGVMPFTKTPVNLVRRGIDYSPLGIVKGIGRILNKDQATVVKGLDNISSGLTGAGIMGLGAYLYTQGLLEGKVPYDAEGNFKKLQGEQGYSIKFGDKSYTVDWAVPFAFPLLTGVEFAKQAEIDGFTPNGMLTALSDLVTPITELSLMSGVSDVIQSATSGDSAGVLMNIGTTALTGYAGQFVPTVLGQVSRTIDPTRRTTTSTKEGSLNRQLDKFVKKQQAKIPGLSTKLEPYVDEWGRTQTSPLGERIVENFLSPGYISKKNITPVDEELASLYQDLPDETKNSILPKLKSDYTVTFQSNKERLQPKDMTTYNKTKGKESYKALAKLIKTDAYKTASTEERSKMIANVFEKSGKLAKIDTLLSKGKDEWKVYTDDFSGGKADYQSAKKAGISAKDYYTAFDNADKDDNGSVSQYEAYKKLEKTKFTKEQKAVLWAKFNKSWKNNPYLGGKIPSTGKSGSSGSSSGGSRKSSSGLSSNYTGLATKQVNKLKTLNLSSNQLSASEVKAIIKLLSR